MMQIIAECIAGWLRDQGAVLNDDIELFAYAVYSMLHGLLPVFIVLAYGYLGGMVNESLLMIMPFMLLRKFSGGFHLKSARKCILLTCFFLGTALMLVSWLQEKNCSAFPFVVALGSICSLCKFSPICNPSRKLSTKEVVLFKKIVQVISMTMFAFYLLLHCFAPIGYSIALAIGIFIAALLQIPCIGNKHYLQNIQ